MQPVIDELRAKGLLTESEGAEVVNLDDYGMPPALILKSDGATLYATRDLAAAFYRKKTYDFYKCLYVVAYQQNLHFRQLFKVLELMGCDWAKDCVHVPFGMVSLEGQGALSTRKGNVVFLDEVLDTAEKKALAVIEQKSPNLKTKPKSPAKSGWERSCSARSPTAVSRISLSPTTKRCLSTAKPRLTFSIRTRVAVPSSKRRAR